MKPRSFILQIGVMMTTLAMALTLALPVQAEELMLKRGTDVKLAFDDPMSSKTAHDGQIVHFHVTEPVRVDDKIVIAEGTEVIGTVVKVSKHHVYGINAKIQLSMSPIRLVDGHHAQLGFKTKSPNGNGRTGGAAAATIGGAIILGPVGLIGGLFVPGKSVNVKPGDKMTVQIDQDTMVHVR